MGSYLLIIGEREALAWVLKEERMAFPALRRLAASKLEAGDELLLYTTRGCFHSPSRHRGRVVGVAEVMTKPEDLPTPVELAGRSFPIGLRLRILMLAPFGRGAELGPLIPQLESFPNKTGWATSLRRPLFQLTTTDAGMLKEEVCKDAVAVSDGVASYLAVVPSDR